MRYFLDATNALPSPASLPASLILNPLTRRATRRDGVPELRIRAMLEAERRDPPGPGLLGALVNARDRAPVDDDRLVDDLRLVLLAGHETSASTMAWATAVCAAREALRLYPPAPLDLRRAMASIDLAGFIVPVGTDVLVPILHESRDASRYPDPDRFGPERPEGKPLQKLADDPRVWVA